MTNIDQSLNEVCQQFADGRFHLCDIQAVSVTSRRITLTGSALDEATLTAVTDHLYTQYPHAEIDTTAVTILRQPNPTHLTISVPITDLRAGPGWASEQYSQLFNGEMVEFLREDGRWAFARQADGYLGWMYRPYLGLDAPPEATHLVCEPIGLLQQAPQADAPLVSRLLGGTAVAVSRSVGEWLCLELCGGLTGWLPANQLRARSSVPQDADAIRQQLIADARQFTGIPYLWGGRSGYGLDCSGFVQLVYRLSGITLPRDADLQMTDGRAVEPPFQPGDLLFFGEDGGHRRISHVGMSLGGWQMIHSSRSRNGVYEDDVQAVDHLRESFVGAVSYLEIRD
ncbi:MAG: hypothetical protein HF973_17315 [Chloroflexi bacterium]|nr:hypothetical protein [Chloroflexota bacterium]